VYLGFTQSTRVSIVDMDANGCGLPDVNPDCQGAFQMPGKETAYQQSRMVPGQSGGHSVPRAKMTTAQTCISTAAHAHTAGRSRTSPWRSRRPAERVELKGSGLLNGGLSEKTLEIAKAIIKSL